MHLALCWALDNTYISFNPLKTLSICVSLFQYTDGKTTAQGGLNNMPHVTHIVWGRARIKHGGKVPLCYLAHNSYKMNTDSFIKYLMRVWSL